MLSHSWDIGFDSIYNEGGDVVAGRISIQES